MASRKDILETHSKTTDAVNALGAGTDENKNAIILNWNKINYCTKPFYSKFLCIDTPKKSSNNTL